ncbi:MAG: hypothetical protein ACP5M5_13395 [Acidibrevibacterium sp.]|uniref:Npun_F0296 family exosortase-dependent surface protein n=1 Tax=Acidibrevibacterium sp. TaxID=2606776 RepID=UPI003CFBF41C
MRRTLAVYIFFGIFLACPRADAGPALLYYVSTQEGYATPPVGQSVEQLVPTSLGSSDITFGGTASVAFNDGAHVVNGTNNYAVGGGYAAPILPNGTPYSDNYYSTETGSVIFSFYDEQKYLGLLWGSVDTESNGNLLTFYNDGVMVGQISGAQLIALAGNITNFYVGSQVFGGTFYLNITGINGGEFNEMIASSGVPSFEFGQVTVINQAAAGGNGDPIPEPPFLFFLACFVFVFSRRMFARS